MSVRPSRAKMCNWLAGALGSLPVRPWNPADIKRQMELAVDAEKRIQALALIAGELGWHVDASLDYAWELIQQYDKQRDEARAKAQAEPPLNRIDSGGTP